MAVIASLSTSGIAQAANTFTVTNLNDSGPDQGIIGRAAGASTSGYRPLDGDLTSS
jgi:hypothetical protein